MIKIKYLKMLMLSVESWNKWRKNNPEVPYLRGVNLQNANLQNANLQLANLQNANLQGTDLTIANLKATYLQEANLQEANLQRANLQRANLQRANLQNANLQEANLQEADLRGANLRGADLQKADLRGANLQEADLYYIKINKKDINQIVENIQEKYRNEWIIIFDDYDNLITRSIEFPPEYHQAGISILNYFSTVLKKKYPDVKANIKIEQNDLKVTMIIDPVKGDREIIEKALDEYGLVVTGKMTPENYTDDRLLKIDLENQLEIAKTQVKNQKRLLQYQDEQLARKDIQIDRLLNIIESGLKSDSETKNQPEGAKVFISCSEDDILTTNKIYTDLQNKGIIPWVSHKDINAGEKTEFAVRKAVKSSNYFLALLSASSVNERGMFQKELKQAFDILAEFPQDKIFIIPVRLDDCNTNNEALSELHIIDMHKTSWKNGLEKIMKAMQNKTDGKT